MGFTELWGDIPRNRLLDFLGDHPASDYSITELADRTGISRPTIYTALADLEKMRLVLQTRVLGSSRMFRLNTDNPLVVGVLSYDLEMAHDAAEETAGDRSASVRRRR